MILSGLDPTGGAGVLADIRALNAIGVRIAPLVSVLTVQGKSGLEYLDPVDHRTIQRQLSALLQDYSPGAVKIGAMTDPAAIEMIARLMHDHPDVPLVCDPVLRASTGGMEFADEFVREALTGFLMQRITMLTPNLPELEWLSRRSCSTGNDVMNAARGLIDRGCRSVLVKGGHRKGSPIDVLVTSDKIKRFEGNRLPGSIRGTGCHLASAIAGYLALGSTPEEAVRNSRELVRRLFEHYESFGILPADYRGGGTNEKI